MWFPLSHRNFSVQKACTNGHSFRFSTMLLNKHSIKLYTTSYDVSWWSAATSFHSTLVFNIICKYIQTIPFTTGCCFMWKGRQTNGIITDGNLRYQWNVCELTSGSSFIEENVIAIGSSSSFIHISSLSIFILMTSFLSSEDHSLVSLYKPCSTLSASVQLCKTNVFLSVMCALWHPPKKNYAGRSHCMPIFSWKSPQDQT